VQAAEKNPNTSLYICYWFCLFNLHSSDQSEICWVNLLKVNSSAHIFVTSMIFQVFFTDRFSDRDSEIDVDVERIYGRRPRPLPASS